MLTTLRARIITIALGALLAIGGPTAASAHETAPASTGRGSIIVSKGTNGIGRGSTTSATDQARPIDLNH